MKIVISFYLLLSTYYLYADVPGNKPRPSYDVKITGLSQYNNHVFFVQKNGFVTQLTDSSSVPVPGGFGAPQCIEIWAINKNNLIHTDTLQFCSGDSKKSKTILINIYKRDLSYTDATTKGKKENAVPFSTVNSTQDNNNQFNNYHIMYLISGLSFITLLLLMLFCWRRNKQQALQPIA